MAAMKVSSSGDSEEKNRGKQKAHQTMGFLIVEDFIRISIDFLEKFVSY